MSARSKQFGQKAGAFAFNWAERGFLRRSPADAQRLGEKLAALAWKVDKKHRNRTLSNLELAMPELSPERRLEIARGTYRHFGRVAADFMRAEIRTAKEVLDNITIVGQEHFDDALKEDKGMLMITGHFGNWERMAHYVCLTGYPIAVVAREANDTNITLRMTQKRMAQGVEVLSRGNAAKGIISRLREKRLIGILPDQNAGDAFVQFFGKPCGTVLGPAVLHKRTGAPLLPVYCAYTGDGKYEITAFPPIRATHDESPEEIMFQLHAALEVMIRRYPEQWLWMHDRWKSARRAGML